MNIDLSTISLAGSISLIIVVIIVAGLIIFVINSIRSLRIKTNKFCIETNEQMQQLKNQTVDDNINKVASSSKEVLRKQGTLTTHHISVIAGDLRDLFNRSFGLTQVQKDMVWILVDLFIAELRYQIINNFSENHIGTTDEEIECYTRLRSREYSNMAKNFFDSYDWTIPGFRLKDAIKDLPPDYFFTKLYLIYKDGKSFEKT